MISLTNPSRPDEGIDINAVAHAEYRERLINQPIGGPIIEPEPMLPLWAIALGCFVLTPFVLNLVWSLIP